MKLLVLGIVVSMSVSAHAAPPVGGAQPQKPPAPVMPALKAAPARPVIPAHLNVSGSVAAGQVKVYTIAVVAGRTLFVRTFSAHDVDLYIQVGQAPTTEAYLARGYTTSGNETIKYTPASNGTLYIGVHGYQAASFTVRTADH